MKKKTAGPVGKSAVLKETKKKAKKTNEIDEIFAKAREAKKTEEKKETKKDEKKGKDMLSAIERLKKKKEMREKKEKEKMKMEITGGRKASQRKKTEEGFNIYTTEELQINPDSGNTPLCPFDCDCCH